MRTAGRRPRAGAAAAAALALCACADEGLAPLAVRGAVAVTAEPDCNPLASTGECLFPFPSRFFEKADPASPTGVRWSLADDAVDFGGAKPIRLTRFNRADGASPVSPILIHLGVDVDPAALVGQREIERSLAPDAPIAVFELDTGARVPVVTEMDQNRRGDDAYVGRHALVIRPMVPMRMGARHVVALRRSLRDASGAPLASPPGFAALRDGLPTDHAALEAARPAFDALFAFLGARGWERDELLLAWDFAVASREHVLGPILGMRAQALAQIDTAGHAYTITSLEKDKNPNTALLVQGDFAAPCFLDDESEIHFDEAGAPIQQGWCPFPFTMIVPAVAKEKGALPLTLFGHGIFGSGRDYLAGDIGEQSLQPLAQVAGSVLLATDWIGLSQGDLELIIDEVVTDLNRISIVTDRLQQSLVNNLVLIDLMLDVLQFDPQLALGPKQLVATHAVNYYGVSLGGIQGSSLTSLSRDITHAVLAVPGGAWSTMLPRSVVYTPVKELVDQHYPDPLLQATFVAVLQQAFDPSDPANVGLLAYRERLPDAPAERVMLYQEAVGDCQVPNIATRLVARSIGLELLEPAAEPVFGLDVVPAPPPEGSAPTPTAALEMYVMPAELADYTPPDAPVVPEKDNGVHSGSVSLPPAVAQALGVLAKGRIERFCDGVCDPD